MTHQVVSEELHDESRVLVALLAQGVKFCVQLENGTWCVLKTIERRTYQQWHRQTQAWPSGKPGQAS